MAYQWNQTLWNTDGNMVSNPDFSDKVNVMLQVQVCRNITKPIVPAACNVSAPAYMVRQQLKKNKPNDYNNITTLTYTRRKVKNALVVYSSFLYYLRECCFQ